VCFFRQEGNRRLTGRDKKLSFTRLYEPKAHISD